VASFFAAGLAATACSGGNDDNGNNGPDATPSPGDDDDDDDGGTPGPGPTPHPGTGFSAFVIDLIENQTADDTEPVAVDYDTTDDETPGAFDSLF